MPQLAEKVKDGATLPASGDRDVLCYVITPRGHFRHQQGYRHKGHEYMQRKHQLIHTCPEKVSPQYPTLSRAETTRHEKACEERARANLWIHLRMGC